MRQRGLKDKVRYSEPLYFKLKHRYTVQVSTMSSLSTAAAEVCGPSVC
jgi:hypothetical protein